VPQTSDEFDSTKLGLQWQWQANPDPKWFSLTEEKGSLRLFSIPVLEKDFNLWNVPNLLLQKISAPEFCVTTKMNFHPANENDLSGLVLMGSDYSSLALKKGDGGIKIIKATYQYANKDGREIEEESQIIKNGSVFLRICMSNGGMSEFSFSTDGKEFKKTGNKFLAKKELWIGAKIGLFSISTSNTPAGYSDFEWFRINKK
jgi:beta-xylosidase